MAFIVSYDFSVYVDVWRKVMKLLSDLFSKKRFGLTGIICLCFLLTSNAYLSWTYNLVELADLPLSDAVSLIAAYAVQAAGIGLFSLILLKRKKLIRVLLCAVLALHLICFIVSAMNSSLILVLVFGLAQNLFCGWIAGFYLYLLAMHADESSAAMILCAGYASSIIFSWLLSLPGDGSLYHSKNAVLLCVFLTAAVVAAVHSLSSLDADTDRVIDEIPYQGQIPREKADHRLLFSAAGLVFLFSIVNSCGSGFSSADFGSGVSVEFSRLFYAVGLLIAGFVNTKSRRYGAICTLISLLAPFLSLAVRGENVPTLVFWCFGYFTSGFYTVHRIIIFSDIACERGILWLSGAGLLFGRIGDAAGEALCLFMSDHFLLLIGTAAALFILSSLLFFRLYPLIYLSHTSTAPRSENDIFNHFSARYELTGREREVLRLLLVEKTNTQIADELSITEGTVKYHIHNLLQKTGCRNRVALISAYSSKQDI